LSGQWCEQSGSQREKPSQSRGGSEIGTSHAGENRHHRRKGRRREQNHCDNYVTLESECLHDHDGKSGYKQSSAAESL
jgi:hypothetical protein